MLASGPKLAANNPVGCAETKRVQPARSIESADVEAKQRTLVAVPAGVETDWQGEAAHAQVSQARHDGTECGPWGVFGPCRASRSW